MKLADTLVRHSRTDGLQALQKRGCDGARELSTWRLCLPSGGRASHVLADEETIAVLLNGAANVHAAGESWHVSRQGVFAERATALYLPPGERLLVDAETPIEMVLFSTPAPAGGRPALVTPTDVQASPRGRDNYRREVHDLFVRDPHARRLIVGETFNPPGNWSSYPPHKHDGRDGEPRLEELYYYRIDPPCGFGLQHLYAADGEAATHVVRDGDAVLLPYGYHPVTAAPGYRLYYLWGMAGDERRLAVHEDPDHAWVGKSAATETKR